MAIAEVGRRSHDHIGTAQDKQAREDMFILNARGQKDSVSDVGGVANRFSTGPHKAAFDFDILRDVSTPAVQGHYRW